MIQEKISRLFPYWQTNVYIEKDESIQNSILVKEQTLEHTNIHREKAVAKKPNPWKKAYKVSVYSIKKWYVVYILTIYVFSFIL